MTDHAIIVERLRVRRGHRRARRRLPRVPAEWNPVTAIAEAVRKLFGNPGVELKGDVPWSRVHRVGNSIVWIVAIIVICAPLAVRACQKRTAE